MEDARKKSLSERIVASRISLINNIIKMIIILALIIIFFFPYKKAEVDNTVFLINPITLIYTSATYDTNTFEVRSQRRGIAEQYKFKAYDEIEKHYSFGLTEIDSRAFEEEGNLSFLKALRMCFFI